MIPLPARHHAKDATHQAGQTPIQCQRQTLDIMNSSRLVGTVDLNALAIIHEDSVPFIQTTRELPYIVGFVNVMFKKKNEFVEYRPTEIDERTTVCACLCPLKCNLQEIISMVLFVDCWWLVFFRNSLSQGGQMLLDSKADQKILGCCARCNAPPRLREKLAPGSGVRGGPTNLLRPTSARLRPERSHKRASRSRSPWPAGKTAYPCSQVLSACRHTHLGTSALCQDTADLPITATYRGFHNHEKPYAASIAPCSTRRPETNLRRSPNAPQDSTGTPSVQGSPPRPERKRYTFHEPTRDSSKEQPSQRHGAPSQRTTSNAPRGRRHRAKLENLGENTPWPRWRRREAAARRNGTLDSHQRPQPRTQHLGDTRQSRG